MKTYTIEALVILSDETAVTVSKTLSLTNEEFESLFGEELVSKAILSIKSLFTHSIIFIDNFSLTYDDCIL